MTPFTMPPAQPMPSCTQTPRFSQLFLRLSRACLGKVIICSKKERRNKTPGVFLLAWSVMMPFSTIDMNIENTTTRIETATTAQDTAVLTVRRLRG
jgi:hypothetical protein